MNKDDIYILNPEYKLKNDINKGLLYSNYKNETEHYRRRISFLHPIQAIIFSFFTHRRAWGENITIISSYLSTPIDIIEKMLIPFCDNTNNLHLKFGSHKIFIPQNMLVNEKTIAKKYNLQNLSPDDFKYKEINLDSLRINIAPSSITFMLTNKCATNCLYCYADTKTNIKKSISTERILEIIKQADSLDALKIDLIGGEIFLHKDWHIILKELVDRNLQPDILSTKLPITDDIIDRLKETRFKNNIQISIDSLRSDVLKETLSVRDNYVDNIKNGIRILNKNRIPFQITTILTKYNVDISQIEELFNFIKDFDMLKKWEIRPAMNSLYQKEANFENIKAKKQKIDSLYEYINNHISNSAIFPIYLIRDVIDKKYFEEKKGSVNFKGSKCSALNSHIFVLPDGLVTICEQLYWNSSFIIGDLTKQDIVEVWNSPRALHLAKMKQEFIQETSPCSNCTIFSECFSANNRCWADIIKAYGTDNWDFPDPRCTEAPSMYHNIAY